LKFLNRLYASITCSKISNIPYNLIFITKFNDSSILITIISCNYLNLSLANEYVGDVTMPTQVIKYNQYFLQADQSIRLQYSHQIKLHIHVYIYKKPRKLCYLLFVIYFTYIVKQFLSKQFTTNTDTSPTNHM